MTTAEPPDDVAHRPSESFAEATNVRQFMQTYDVDSYEELIERTTTDVDDEPASGLDWFWDEVIDYLGLEFYTEYDAVRDDREAPRASDRASGETASSEGPQFTDWYPGGELNIAHNVLDRHAALENGSRNHAAILWEGEPGETRTVTYHELHRETNQVANYLDSVGVGVGDTVGLYMPMVPEVASILYACFKVGAIAVPIFSGFGVDAVATRIADAECSVLFTGDGFFRRGEPVLLKPTADEAIEEVGHVEHTVVYDRLGASGPNSDVRVAWEDDRDVWWHRSVGEADDDFETRSLPSDAESMLLYSSGTTGKPKGIVHTHAGPLVQAAKEIYFGFDHKPHDRFFWVSDIGWMMGPWALIGNHAFGGTVFVYEGAPDYPEPDRYWDMIDRHGLTVFGVSPTAIRALREHGRRRTESDEMSEPDGLGHDEWVERHDLSSLRILGSTGEPWDEESWHWFHENVGGGEAPIVNIAGGTEIMGCFLMPMPDQPLKPNTLGGPGLGMDIDIVNSEGESIKDSGERGFLVARDSCPSMTKSLWSGDERYIEEYWSTWEDLWDHGDWAQVDADGFWYLHGRADDALNVAGRKVGPAEVEGAAIEHPAVSQAAAVGAEDETTGTAIALYVVLEPDHEPTDALREEIRETVGQELGKPFRPRDVRFVSEFPKTQSGKIIRRAIGAVHSGEDPGELSSLANPEALERIREAR